MSEPAAAALLDLAVRVGREAAERLRHTRPAGRVAVAATKSSATDVVTELDRSTEDFIRASLLAARPDDAFVGEEGRDCAGTSGVEWIVDPIDGTVNFIYGIAAYAVSIAARHAGKVVAGYVTNVATGEEWSASLGSGSHRLDSPGGPFTAPPAPTLDRALVATGFAYDAATRARQGQAVAALLPQVRDIRRIGAAALDLCAVAEGRVDAYVEQGLHEWDLAAGGLIAAEAGLVVRGLDGPADRRLVIAAGPELIGEFVEAVRACGF